MMILLSVLHKTIRPLQRVKIVETVNLNLTRSYVRWVSRKPVTIVNEDELFECEDTTKSPVLSEMKVSKKRSRKMKPSKETKTTKTSTSEKKQKFTKLLKIDKIVSSLMINLRSRKKREKNNQIILEGQRLIKDAMKVGLIPDTILFNDPSDIKELNFPEQVTLYKVPYKTIQLWSSLTNSPGLLGIFKTPDVHNNARPSDALPLTIICDNIREPGNLGSIMRAAAAVGCEKLILMKGCVDLWDPKVLRSAAGTQFRIPIHSFPTWDIIPSLINEKCNIFIADSNFGDEFLSNYAPDVLQSSLEIFDIDPENLKSKYTFANNTTEQDRELTLPTNRKMMKDFMLNFPIVPYYSLDYTKKESVIILSGETEGLSLNSYKFLNERKSIRINIPLVQGIDSLNAGVALGIVIFEIKRQFLKKQCTYRLNFSNTG